MYPSRKFETKCIQSAAFPYQVNANPIKLSSIYIHFVDTYYGYLLNTTDCLF